MTFDLSRRHALAALAALAPATAAQAAPPAAGGPERAFDYFLGTWDVRHRRLRKRLAGNTDWEEFGGRTTCIPLMGGMANLNDSVSHRGGGTAYGVGLRAYDARSGTWADWTLSGGDPSRIDAPNVGRFEGRVGTFFADDTFEGRPIRVRGTFTSIRDGEAQWEQAFSPDAGQSWETNWVMRYSRIG